MHVLIGFDHTERRQACTSSETIDLRTLEFGLASTRCPSTTGERVTNLHIIVPAITRGTLARSHELKVKCCWILGSVLDSGMCFEFWEVYLDSGMCFWILGSFLGSGDVFWILEIEVFWKLWATVGYWRRTEIRKEETRDDNTRREISYFQAAM